MPSQDVLAASPAATSHMMKVTKRGRPFLKDTLDLFATLVVSLQLTTHKQLFKNYPHSFTTDDAAVNLASLKFSQSNRGPDPRDSSRIVTTTTTTTFSMTREMAKAMCQHFMDARLIENAAEPSTNLFRERGVYILTPKGLHVLERFIAKNGISADTLAPVFTSQAICLKLLHLERRSSDDEIIISQGVVLALFRRFAGMSANYMPDTQGMDVKECHKLRAQGIPLMDVPERSTGLIGRSSSTTLKNCFQAVTALEWLCDFTSIVGRDEAAEMAAHFVRFGFITLVSDKRKGNDSAIIFTVRGTVPTGNSNVMQQGEFRCTQRAIYRITDEGRVVARWDPNGRSLVSRDSPNNSSSNLSKTERPSTEKGYGDSKISLGTSTETKLSRRASVSERLNHSGLKESNTDRLKTILEDYGLRKLFREFLGSNFCEENLTFWLDVEDFKQTFNITSSAIAPNAELARQGRNTPGQAAMERHHTRLIEQAFKIYNQFLAPSSPSELNIDHGLRNELVSYLSEQISNATGRSFQGRVEPEQANSLNATQIQTMIGLYNRIQTHVFRLMATDSVPKFISTPRYATIVRTRLNEYGVESDDVVQSNPPVPPGLEEEEVGRTYMTISQRAQGEYLGLS